LGKPWNEWGACEAARRLARRELRAEELLRACVERIDQREPDVRAFVHRDHEAALAAARALDAGPVRGPLHGLPLGIKDLFDTHDLPSAYGSPIHAGHRARFDAAAVARCRAAGAVVVGKTVTTEFATFEPGPTRNPHDLERTPGGSSSGSAAAVADAMLPLAFGTQTAGSIIRPAAYCGVVGFKPTYGRVARSGMKLLSESLDTVGGFGRSVEDAALLAAVLTGDDRLLALPPLASPPRVGFFQGPDWHGVDAATQQLWSELAARLARRTNGSGDVATPAGFESLAALQAEVMAFEAAASLTVERREHADLLSPRLRTLLDEGQALGGAAHAANLQRLHEARAASGALFARRSVHGATADAVDVLIAPSASGEAVLASTGTGDPLFCRPWSLLGLPCLHLPLGRGVHGLPIGVQVIGPAFDDARVLAVGAWVMAAWQTA
jgi:Asp-tRNA(Asn)/Glu-tRNA(Gln) amidotransferase A subunit family amidase